MIAAPVGHQCPECVNDARREFRQGPGRRVAVATVKRSLSATSVLLGLMGAMYVIEVIAGGPRSPRTRRGTWSGSRPVRTGG